MTNSETKEEVAIKKIGNAFDNSIDAKRTLREIKLLSHMDHENVLIWRSRTSCILSFLYMICCHFSIFLFKIFIFIDNFVKGSSVKDIVFVL